jgi:hypothetical protein
MRLNIGRITAQWPSGVEKWMFGVFIRIRHKTHILVSGLNTAWIEVKQCHFCCFESRWWRVSSSHVQTRGAGFQMSLNKLVVSWGVKASNVGGTHLFSQGFSLLFAFSFLNLPPCSSYIILYYQPLLIL